MAVPGLRDLTVRLAGARDRWHPLGLRVQLVVVLAIAFAAFSLPFLTVSEELVARATGYELVRAAPHLSGRYVHVQYRGEVESLVEQGRVPAALALALTVVAALAALVPGRKSLWVAAAAGAAGFMATLALSQTTSSQFVTTARHAGWWLLAACLALAAALAAAAALRDPPDVDAPRRWRYEPR